MKSVSAFKYIVVNGRFWYSFRLEENHFAIRNSKDTPLKRYVLIEPDIVSSDPITKVVAFNAEEIEWNRAVAWYPEF